ncbi:unnamed protein product [Prunus brigantina]
MYANVKLLKGLQELGNILHSGNASATPNVNSDDIYEDLGDLGKMARVNEDGFYFSNVHNSICAPAQLQLGDNEQFLELDDLSCFRSQSSEYFERKNPQKEEEEKIGKSCVRDRESQKSRQRVRRLAFYKERSSHSGALASPYGVVLI